MACDWGWSAQSFSPPPPSAHSPPPHPQDTGATYKYTIGGGGESSPTYSFVANPAKGAKARMSFAVYGDMGETKYRASKNPM